MKKNKGRARYKKNKLKKRNKAYTGGINLPEGFKLPKDFKLPTNTTTVKPPPTKSNMTLEERDMVDSGVPADAEELTAQRPDGTRAVDRGIATGPADSSVYNIQDGQVQNGGGQVQNGGTQNNNPYGIPIGYSYTANGLTYTWNGTSWDITGNSSGGGDGTETNPTFEEERADRVQRTGQSAEAIASGTMPENIPTIPNPETLL